ncbi:hypothetical protein NE237_016869 [Protea cynaroides]|uniref:Uncharacterized protein n=1 Tax=Protea cynaroides TaxID=273540 RepID=A0A9Q0HHZ2_9MAGN|nr:hypothetical protein NE237_016869 [Protea cynaroides]
MELPECPVCLQVYNSDDTVPRVLACGHSACEACLKQLPLRFSNTIRCPACTQLVKYPEFQGPSALPKNIDLLSFIDSQNPKNTNPSQSCNQTRILLTQSSADAPKSREFLPRLLWSQEFYSDWKDWILPVDSVSVVERGEGLLHCCALQGKIESSSLASESTRYCFPGENQLVSLVRVGNSSVPDSAFKLSYKARVMEALNRLKESERTELGLILRASLRQRRVCKVYGLWMNSEDGSVYLVCEKFNGDFTKRLSWLMNGDVGDNSDELTGLGRLNLEANGKLTAFAMVGTELCEALMGLHSEGLVSGCLAFSCFSVDDFGRIFVDINEILVMGRRVRRYISEAFRTKGDDCETEALLANLSDIQSFVSLELLFELLNYERITAETGNSGYSIGYGSDIWSLACILVRLLVGDRSTEELFKGFYIISLKVSDENSGGYLSVYEGWMEKVSSELETCLGSKFSSLQQVLCRCLNFDPANRPHATEIWRCIRELLINPHNDTVASLDATFVHKNMVHCFIVGDMCHLHKETDKVQENQNRDGLQSDGSSGADVDQVGDGKVGRDLINGLCVGSLNSINLQAHLDCITKLAVGGGFLFSSSYDKTVNVWNLQDFSHLQSLKGHEHRVMDIVFVDSNEPLCISADNGGGIFVWSIGISVDQKPLRTWYEPKDWRYSGIHSLAIFETEQLYTGSGDKSIKAWSLQDYSLTCTMTGHKSIVSSLEVYDGVLYSGSWDGTIRLWSLNDHSPLAVLGDDMQGNVNPVLSLSVGRDLLVASYENGCVKMWRDDVIMRSSQIHSGAILSLAMDGKWIFMGGWDKIIDVQELSGDDLQIDIRSLGSITCDSVPTALLFWQGKLFVGFAGGVIKVYIMNYD